MAGIRHLAALWQAFWRDLATMAETSAMEIEADANSYLEEHPYMANSFNYQGTRLNVALRRMIAEMWFALAGGRAKE